MSTGHEDELAGQPGTSRDTPLIDPVWFETPEMRRILTGRDIGALYHALKDLGVSQRQIAACTGQAQSEVSEILTGRQVRDVTVLERIADGLGIPRGHLRLASGDRDDGAYSGSEGGADPEVDEEMRRRALIATTALATLGRVVQGMGELALPRTDDEPLPSRLSMAHVQAVVYMRAGEPRGLVLAQQAIDAVSTPQSVAVRRERLDPLIAALDARPSNDARELARTARNVAAGKPPQIG